MVNLAKCYITLSLWGDIQILPRSLPTENSFDNFMQALTYRTSSKTSMLTLKCQGLFVQESLYETT